MSFDYHVDLSDPNGAGGASDAVLVDDLDKALAIWSGYVSGKGTLEVELNIASDAVGREDGGPTGVVRSGTSSTGVPLYEPSSLYELQTGQHVSGHSADISIDVSPSYLSHLDLSPGIEADSQTASNTLNPISVFLHEVMHGFGMVGYRDTSGDLPGNYESTFDQYIQKTDSGTAYFTGPNAEAANGGPVQLTTDGGSESYYHFGDTDSDFNRTASTVTDPLTLDLMNGIVFFTNHDYQVSQLDLGVLKDLGYDVSSGMPASDGTPQVQYVDNGDGTHAITGTADGQTLQSVGNDVMTGGGSQQTFVFTPHFGQDEITDFVVGSAKHDTIDLSNTQYKYIGQVLRHTTMVDGNAVIQLNPVDSITLDGVTTAQLTRHRGDFTFA